MIRIKGNPVSEAYAEYCAKSWEAVDWDFEFYDAVTPDTLDQQDGALRFDLKQKKLTETEKACFYSQYNLWKECAKGLTPYLVLEHDAFLEKPEAIIANPELFIQYFGQHSMEAVLYTPAGCRRLMGYIKRNKVIGPMRTVDDCIGMFNNKDPQSSFRLPHARFIGPYAPVKSVVDLSLGTTIDKVNGRQVVDRIIEDDQANLFKVVSLKR